MGLFKKKKPAVETPEQKMENLRKQLTSLNQKAFQIKRMVSGYEQQINKCISNIKQNPDNQYLITSTKNTLKYLITKKKLYEKFGSIIEATKALVETKYTEISLTRGEDLIDSNFCDEISKMYSTCDEYTDMIDKATSIDQLTALMDSFSNSMGSAMGVNADDEVDSLINDALGQKKEEKEIVKEKNVETEKKENEVDIEKLLDNIRKSM